MNLSSLLEGERRARLAAERLLEMRQQELRTANRKLAEHARSLTTEIIERRDEVHSIRVQSHSLEGEYVQTKEDLQRARDAADIAQNRLWSALQTVRDGFAMFDKDRRLVVANKAYLSIFDGLDCMAPGIEYADVVDILLDEGIIDPQGPPDAWRAAFKQRWDVEQPEPAVLKLWNGQFVKLVDRRMADGGIVSLGMNETENLRMWSAIEAIPDGFVLFDHDDRLIMCNDRFRKIYDRNAESITIGATFEEILLSSLSMKQIHGIDGHEEEWLENRLTAFRQAEYEAEQMLPDGRWLRVIERATPDGGRVGMRIDITATKAQQAALELERERAEAANRAKSNFLANMSHEIRTPLNGVIGMAEMLCGEPLSAEQKDCAETIRNSGHALLRILNDVLDFSRLEADKMPVNAAPFDIERCIIAVVRLLQPVARTAGLPIFTDVAHDLEPMVVGDEGRIRQILTNLIGNAVKFTDRGHIVVRARRDPASGDLVIEVEDTGIGIAEAKLEHVFGVFNQADDGHDRPYDGTGLGLAITRHLAQRMDGQITVRSTLGEGSVFTVSLPLAGMSEGFEPFAVAPGHRAAVVGPASALRDTLCRQLTAMGVAARQVSDADWPDAPSPNPAGEVVFALAPLPGDATAAKILRVESSPQSLGPVAPDTLGLPISRETLRDLFEDVAVEPGPLAPPPEKTEAVPGPRALRVLAAEDNLTNRLVLAKMLKTADIELRIVGNGVEAVEAYGEAAPDLVLMDISMPVMDGREAARRIRQHEAAQGLPRVPIHAMTAHALSGDADDSLAAGIDTHITKPLSKAKLLAVIEAARTGTPVQVDG